MAAGPSVVKATGVSVTASEVAVATVIGSWNQAGGQVGVQGNFLQAQLNLTPGASQTSTTFRIRQGTGVAGTLVGIAHPTVTVAAQQADWSFDEFDSTAFAQQGAVQSYTLTVQANAAGPGTINEAYLSLETSAPVG